MKRALISVSDKTNIVWFAKNLAKLGWEIISTGGTASYLEEAGLEIIPVSDITGFPECFDGRVKTLHPKIHGGILNIRNRSQHRDEKRKLGIDDIDLVCVNLYPFEETVEANKDFSECIENIDIGGPAMIRSAAKNFPYVLVVTNPEQYERVIKALESDEVDNHLRLELAYEAFSCTNSYDEAIQAYLHRFVR